MFPQVCAKCLPKRSSVSTAVCGFVYARACTCSCACVSSSFSFIRCVWSWWWCWGSTTACCFLLLLFLAPDKRRRVRGAVLGDETAVAMAGCNTSSHCGGWLEALEETGSPPLYLHWHICSAIRFLTRPGIRKNKTKNKSNKPPPQTARSRRPHVGIYWNGTPPPPNCIIVLIDVVGRGGVRKAGLCCCIQGRPGRILAEQYGGVRLITNVDVILFSSDWLKQVDTTSLWAPMVECICTTWIQIITSPSRCCFRHKLLDWTCCFTSLIWMM